MAELLELFSERLPIESICLALGCFFCKESGRQGNRLRVECETKQRTLCSQPPARCRVCAGEGNQKIRGPQFGKPEADVRGRLLSTERERNAERLQRVSKRTEVFGTRQNREIHIPAEFSGAVRHARLTSHEERPDAVRAHRRKDSEYRVRDQASPRVRGTIPRAFRFPTIVEPGSYGTTQPTRNRQGPQGSPAADSSDCSSYVIQAMSVADRRHANRSLLRIIEIRQRPASFALSPRGGGLRWDQIALLVSAQNSAQAQSTSLGTLANGPSPSTSPERSRITKRLGRGTPSRSKIERAAIVAAKTAYCW